MGLGQGPFDVAIKASLTQRNAFLNIMKKGKLRNPDFMMLSGGRMKELGQNMSCRTNLFRHIIVENIMNLGKQSMHLQSCNHATVRTLERGNSFSQNSPAMRNKLLCI